MTFSISQQGYWDLATEAAQTSPQDPNLSTFEVLYPVPDQIGVGVERWCQFMPEFSSIYQGQLHQISQFYVSERSHGVELQLVLSGVLTNESGEIVRAGQSHMIGSGIAPKGNTVEGVEPSTILYLSLEPQVILDFLGKPFEQLPDALQRLTQTQEQQIWLPSQGLTPAMREIVQQILHCPYTDDIVRQMYLQSKVFELLALHLAPILQDDQRLESFVAMENQDIDRIHHAQEILLKQMENPPSLLSLAKQVGINDYKLKVGFRQVFSTTVFGYLLEQRLLRSRFLLEMGEMTVAEVSWAVGFNSRTHFSTAFKGKFGITPSQYRQAKRFAS